MDIVTKVRIDLRANVIELEGTELFVKEQLEKYEEFIMYSQKSVSVEKSMQNNSVKNTSNKDDMYVKVFGMPKESVDTVIHTEETEFSIITKKIKGGNSEKQINYTLLYCLGKEFLGVTEVSFKELRNLCSNNACLDSGNFAGYYKKHKDYFLVLGKSGSTNKTLKLTVPGRRKAQELLASLVV